MKRMHAAFMFAAMLAAPSFAAPARAAEAVKPVATIEDLPREARLALYNAQLHLEKSEIDPAVAELEKYIRANEKKNDSFILRYQLAGILLQAGRTEDALAQYERVVKLEPRYAPGWVSLGETAYGLGHFTRAAQALKEGYTRSDEKKPDVLYYAVVAQVQAGDAAGALPVLDALTDGTHGTPRFEWYRGMVSTCLQAEDKERGKKAVASMLERFGTQADAWYLAFQYHASVSDYREAAVALTVVGYLRPLSRQEQLQLGDLYAAVDAPAAAADRYAAATRDSASAGETERVASAFLASYQPDSARVVLDEGLRTQPTFRLWSLLGDLHVMEKRFDEAYQAFSACVKLSPEAPRPHLMLGYCALEMNQPDLAMTHLTIAAGNEEFAERAQMLIQRAQIMRSAPTPEPARSSVP